MQVDPIKPTLKAPGFKLLKLKMTEPLSHFAFKFSLCRYTKEESSRWEATMWGRTRYYSLVELDGEVPKAGAYTRSLFS